MEGSGDRGAFKPHRCAMLDVKQILLPIDFPSTCFAVVHQAATLARQFRSTIVMLHVVTAESHAAGVPEDPRVLASWDLRAAVIQEALKQGDQFLERDLEGLTMKCLLVQGDPSRAIVQTAAEQQAALIMMSSHGATFDQFLLGSVTARVLHGTDCPIWTSAHLEQSAPRDFVIRKVLCGVDLGPRSELALSWANRIASDFGAHLTLAHVTASVELWGPGGSYVVADWKKSLVKDASQRLAKLQQEMGTKAEVYIGSGDVPKVLAETAKQTNADLLVAGCYPYGVNLRTHGYAIICAVPIPVLSV